MKIVHLTLTEFRSESRIIKESISFVKSAVFGRVKIIAIGADDLPVHEKFSDGIDVVRVHLKTRGLPKNIIFQCIKYLEFVLRVLIEVRRFDCDALSIHSVGLLPLGWFSKKINRHKLIYDTHELETEVEGLYGVRKTLLKFIERRFIKSCSLVIVVGENIADWYAKEYAIPRPFVVKNAPFKREPKKSNYFREKLGIGEEQLILLYQGGLVPGRGVETVLRAFQQRTDAQVVVVFMGYGELEMDVREASRVCKNIFFFPAVAPGLVLDYTASADMGISLIENTCLSYYLCLPNKLFEYAMAGLPVLVSDMKEMSELVRNRQMGIVVSDHSPQGVSRAIDELVAMNVASMKENAYQAAIDNAWEVQEKIMLEAYRVVGL